MTPEEVQEKLRLHRLWVFGESWGERANLSGANLRGANLRGANIRGANLSGANLRGANLRGANIRGAGLSGANLSGAGLSGADLSGASLGWANLRQADLTGADLRHAVLSDATGNCKEIKSAHVHTYSLVWTKDVLWIGCQCKTLDEWELFDPRSEGMSKEDSTTWEAHKDWIFETVRRFPAK